VTATFASQVVESRGGDVMVAQNIAFGLIAALMIVAAVRVVTTKNVVHAALYLVIVLAGVAAQFLLLGGVNVGPNTLLRWYVLHVLALPFVLVIFLAVHFWRIRKDGGISGPL